jgi:hydrogenase maturation protease
MNRRIRERWLVVGVGNTYRRDDGVGPYIARLLAERPTPGFAVTEQSGEATALMEAWGDVDGVVIVDAVQGGAPPGTIHRLDAHQAPLATESFRGSSHCLGVIQAIEISRALGRLPVRMTIYGIEGKSFGWGVGLSQHVEHAAHELAEMIVHDLKRRTHRNHV